MVFVLAFEIQRKAYIDSSSQFLAATCFNRSAATWDCGSRAYPVREWRCMLDERQGTKGEALKSRYKKREKTSPKNMKNNTDRQRRIKTTQSVGKRRHWEDRTLQPASLLGTRYQ